MKVVIFCGGLGVRMGEETQRIPKPMIAIGDRPILWHIMRYYAACGHNDFILCLGYKGEVDQGVLPHLQRGALQRLRARAERRRAPSSSCSRATSTTGGSRSSTRACNATIGERLKAVEPYLGDDEAFLATYGDGLTDAPLPRHDRRVPRAAGRLAHVPLGAPAVQRASRDRRTTTAIVHVGRGHEPLRRADQRRLLRLPPRDPRLDRARRRARRGAVRAADRARRARRVPVRRASSAPMDTIKDRQRLEALHESGQRAVAQRRRSTAQREPTPADARARACRRREPLRRVLAIGCHADDIEIGCGGTLLALTRAHPELEVDWVVLAAPGERADEARASAEAFLAGAAAARRRGARVPRRLPAVRRRRGQGGLRGAEGARRPDSSSRTRATTSTRTTGSPAS